MYMNTATCRFDLVTIGEPLISLDTRGRPLDDAPTLDVSVGGAECNVAIGLTRLGRSAAMFGAVGDDPYGRMALRSLRGEGVDVAGVSIEQGTPTALMFKARRGQSTDVEYRRRDCAGARLDSSAIGPAADAARLAHVTCLTAALSDGARDAVVELAGRARAGGARVSLDANFRVKVAPLDRFAEIFDDLAPFADDVILGAGEAATLIGAEPSEQHVRAFAEAIGRPAVIVKRAGGGAWFVEDGVLHEVPARPVAVVDPIGAGDAFAVGLLHGRLAGRSTGDAIGDGVALATRAVAVVGDYQGLPHAGDLDECLAGTEAVRR